MKMERVSLTLLLVMSLLCLCKHMLAVVASPSGLCFDDQRSLLLQLKNNLTLDSDPSKLKTWNDEDCCRWMGVTCDKEGHVTALDLSSESISGGLDNSSALFRLQHLQILNLAYNHFPSVMIPSGLSKLEGLRYLNLSNAGFAGQIPIEISQLTKLVTLDLSYVPYGGFANMYRSFKKMAVDSGGPIVLGNNAYEMYLVIPNLEELLQNMTNIRKLYLNNVIMAAPEKEWSNALLPLHDLQELSMSYCNLSGPLPSSLTRLENLSVIILDGNYLSSLVPNTFANFKNLAHLSLANCGLTGTFPQKIFQIATLSYIDLSRNDVLRGVLPDSLSGSLLTLRVGSTSFFGSIPHFTGNMRHLTELDLSHCQFNGTLPNSLSNLTSLSYLDLSSNSFTGPVPSFLFTQLPLLQEIQLSNNQFYRLDKFMNVTASRLSVLDLSHNQIQGMVPNWIWKLPSLQEVHISNNFLRGLDKFMNVNASRLYILDLSDNQIQGMVTNWIWKLPSLGEVRISNNSLRGLDKFMNVTASRLSVLDLSDNQIQGMVPNWIWKLPSLQRLNISNNFLRGSLFNLTCNLETLDVHNNQLQGSIPVCLEASLQYLDYSRNNFSFVIPLDIGNYMPSIQFLSLSNNNIHGSIPGSLCNASGLGVLDLSINNISGSIPSCLMNMTKLEALNLHKNNLTGHIPDTSLASYALKILNLKENLLGGPIPKSLAQCSKLEVLDLRTNQLIGGFPCFLNRISTLRVLVLRNNKFQGSIGCLKAQKTWNMLQVLDVAFNNFSGKLPQKYFTTWETMMHDDHFRGSDLYYQDSVTVVNKGQQMELDVKILTIFTCIDFSSNHFEGPIPEEMMDFKGLHALNLSNNAFSSEIPSSIGNLSNVESLDLSLNNLHGEIPVQLASLTFLSYLNLSFNHLVGKIPTSTQLQSFQKSSFEGNDGLYGPPLTEEPKVKKQGLQPQAQPSCGKLTCEIDLNFLSVELGSVFGLGTVFFPLLFWKSWRVRYWEFVDKVLCCIFPQLYLEHVTRRGQTYRVLRWWR